MGPGIPENYKDPGNRTHRKVPVRLCSITETIEKQSDGLGSIDYAGPMVLLIQAQGAHTICVCNRLLFYGKCTGFTASPIAIYR